MCAIPLEIMTLAAFYKVKALQSLDTNVPKDISLIIFTPFCDMFPNYLMPPSPETTKENA
jgi:hypothetical protein